MHLILNLNYTRCINNKLDDDFDGEKIKGYKENEYNNIAYAVCLDCGKTSITFIKRNMIK